MQNVKEYIWALVGKFLPQGIYLVTTMILARFLTPDDFGMIAVLTVFFTVAGVLMDAGLGGSLIKENRIEDIDCSTIFVFNLFVSHLIYVILFCLSSEIESFFGQEDLSSIVKVLCLVFVVNSWGLVPKALLMRNLKFKEISNISIISVFIASCCSVTAGIYGLGVYALVIYQLINALINVLLLLNAIKFKISLAFSFNSFKRLIPFGFYTTLVTITDTIYENMITFLFGKYFNMQQAGYLYQAKKIEDVPSQSLIVSINSVAFPVLTRYKDEPVEFIKEARRILETISLFLIPILLTVSLFSVPIIILLYGHEWESSASYLSILIFAGICIVLENINRNFIKALGFVNQLFKYTIVKRGIGIITILITVYIFPEYILYAYIISSILGYIVNNYVYCKIMNINCSKEFYIVLKLLVPNVIYYFVMILVIRYIELVSIQILIASIFLIIYYIYILPLYGIDTHRIMKLFISKRKK